MADRAFFLIANLYNDELHDNGYPPIQPLLAVTWLDLWTLLETYELEKEKYLRCCSSLVAHFERWERSIPWLDFVYYTTDFITYMFPNIQTGELDPGRTRC